MNWYKYPILWWIVFGIPLILLSLLPRRLRQQLHKKNIVIMKQEEKQLLLKDLCARLPYKVKIYLKQTGSIQQKYPEIELIPEYIYTIGISIIRPYLRPMSSMTEEERIELRKFCEIQPQILEDIGIIGKVNSIAVIDFLNAHHFDYRGLIPIGLALEAPEGMYKTE